MCFRILAFILLLCSAVASVAGGPAFIAGSGYNPGIEGQPLIWANGSIQYFTDQGNLSPILTGAQADALVATVFSIWTSISGVALTATQAGHLAEDVNGGNIQTNGFGVVTAPADITPTATGTPVGIVYDYDGTVTDAILGQGAGDLDECFTNAVYGGPDNFAPAGYIVHSLIVINGVCAATTTQLPDIQYRLLRVLGRTIGLGWSQANLNVQTRKPVPTGADYAGFPVMHFTDSIACVPITICYPSPDTPALDDIDSLTRLYPAVTNPQPAGRIYGSVYFTDASGNSLQPMQGVNVVARLMVANQPSRQYVATSVSGFLFCGNAGNIIDGYISPNGLPYSQWGSDDPALEGFFDLGQLMIPAGQTTAQYQLSVEAVDPDWSMGVVSYAPTQVTPSGSFTPVVVTIANGSNNQNDILMLQDELAQDHPGSGSTYANPAPLPLGGSWGSWISPYGSADFFRFTAQANRTASVAVLALDEAGQPTETKLLPVIGIWQLSDQSGKPAPASTPSAFNTTTFALTRLDAQFNVSQAYRVGIADFRGDGRPDYFYQATLLYSDSLTPSRLGLSGGVTTLTGIGFNQQLQASVCGEISPQGTCVDPDNATTLAASATQLQLALPAGLQDGTTTIQVADPATGSFSQMIGALTYGAGSTDLLLLQQGAEAATPVGAAAPNAIRVRAVAADGVTPVSGATLAWSATSGLQLSLCNGAYSCSVLSDEAGESSTLVTPVSVGQSTVTIKLAPESYSPPQTQQATVVATSSALDLAAVTPTRWIAQGATLAVPLTVEALDLGVPKANIAVNFLLTQGTATLSATSAITNSLGFATVTANIVNQNSAVQVSACVAPNNSPCQTFTLFSTPPPLWTLQPVSGTSQAVGAGQVFQPLVIRVTDGSAAANPVLGVTVNFATTLVRLSLNQGGQQDGDSLVSGTGPPVILGSSQAQVVTAPDGTASILPSAQNVGPCTLFVAVSAGASAALFQLENLASIVLPQQENNPGKTPPASNEINFHPGTHASTSQALPISVFAVPGLPSPDQPTPPQNQCSGDTQPITIGDPIPGSCAPAPEAPSTQGDVPSSSGEAPTDDPPAKSPAKPAADSKHPDSGPKATTPAAENPSPTG